MSREVFICEGVRTPIGRFGGALAKLRADDLAAAPIKALMARLPKVDWSKLDEVVYGCANQAGEDNRNVARMALLWQAVVNGDATVALPAFFPESAYLQVKNISNPDADWHGRLVRLYDADIAGLHARVAGHTATLVGVTVPDAATWVLPGSEYNKGSYWRVYGSVVHYEVDGRSSTFVIQSLISWRGEWYVVHLTTPPS